MHPGSDKRPAPTQSDLVGFLSVPESYREHISRVSVIETHHAWVFLTDDYAYKMKKPFRLGRFDFSSLESRRHLCNEEYRLNRCLGGRTYLGVVPVVIGKDGRLDLESEGDVVEWLVKMRRLPHERMLNIAAKSGLATPADIRRLMRKLLRFYGEAPRCRHAASHYDARLRNETQDMRKELLRAEFGFSVPRVSDILDRQIAYIGAHAKLLNERATRGFVREIHGDLRPEHICVMANEEPEIIDRLEFDRDLRCLDFVEEVAFLGLECRVIGQSWIENECIDCYRADGGDPAPTHLWNFYAARRATMRAVLSAWHTLDAEGTDHWLRRGCSYLDLAADYLEGAATL